MKAPLNLSLFTLLFFCSWLKGDAAELPVIYISAESALHFRSPEPISYVDLPKAKFSGDLPLKNLLRIRLRDSFMTTINTARQKYLGVVTITGEHFFAQYQIALAETGHSIPDTEIEILPKDMLPLIPALPSFSTPQMHAKSISLISGRAFKPLGIARNQGISLQVNQIRCAGELIFLDLGFSNNSELSYEVEDLQFSISEEKIYKATNAQQFSLIPKFILSSFERFTHQARNIYVLPKASFSSAKRLRITLSEKQPSSRTVCLELSYGQLLWADSF